MHNSNPKWVVITRENGDVTIVFSDKDFNPTDEEITQFIQRYEIEDIN